MKVTSLPATKDQAVALIKRAKSVGFTHRAIVWIHAGGDDQCAEVFFNREPTTAEMTSFLKRRHSRVLNDYTIEKL